jgi:hypothetical protein
MAGFQELVEGTELDERDPSLGKRRRPDVTLVAFTDAEV